MRESVDPMEKHRLRILKPFEISPTLIMITKFALSIIVDFYVYVSFNNVTLITLKLSEHQSEQSDSSFIAPDTHLREIPIDARQWSIIAPVTSIHGLPRIHGV